MCSWLSMGEGHTTSPPQSFQRGKEVFLPHPWGDVGGFCWRNKTLNGSICSQTRSQLVCVCMRTPQFPSFGSNPLIGEGWMGETLVPHLPQAPFIPPTPRNTLQVNLTLVHRAKPELAPLLPTPFICFYAWLPQRDK